MHIKFCGAAGTTTGSQHLITVNGHKILLDCGLYQGHRQESFHRNKEFDHFDPAELNAVVLSHAHIDHSGNLPNLVKQGFTGNVYSTHATHDLCQVMLRDCAKIQAYDVEYLNRRYAKRGENKRVEVTYDQMDAEQAMRQFVNIGYNRKIPIADGVMMHFRDAGHILGSAQVVLDIDDREDGAKGRLLFSGDVGRGNNELLNDPIAVDGVDWMIMESTYGGREHEMPASAREELSEVLKDAVAKGGKVIIPAFAVERTQQLLFVLHDMIENKEIPRIPVFVDSPLAVSATEIFRLHPECFNEEVYDRLFGRNNPFGFEELTLIRSVQGSKALNKSHEAAIIISASGMCEAGRILHHLRNGIGNPNNTVLFVGYCAENTLGRKIRDGESPVNIFGEPVDVHAEVVAVDSFSGHADHSELMEYFTKTGGPKKQVWLVHGERSRSEAMRDALAAAHPDSEFQVAELGMEVTVKGDL
ncbi:MBL fold metallo-hydrolase [Sulfuriroseicoccus oceanibius]|uniref:MBL fold metallo-hydrolase n=1 Tax=Sulfuriroseicoccus oceanibius TaxID=2707525 RepID=A0A6B3LBV7_9BACT|nr:MBL fold metallo-hydrolase [Sulfuriroseicoccus oceanibius]QQL43954.1 MBL fold metallo-hydrolase [Sulfuriroseicoccus oceanibius]